MGDALPAPSCPRYPTLDAWRGVACLMVVVSHSVWYADADPDPTRLGALLVKACHSLWIGVPLFFVISGYCIAATADTTRRRGAVSREYFTRRLRRIFPTYWAAFALVVLLVPASEALGLQVYNDIDFRLPHVRELDAARWFGNLTLTETWRQHAVGGSAPLLLLGPAWSLCYEEQFYLVVGTLLALAPRRFFAGIAAVTAAVFAAQAVRFTSFAPDVQGFFFDGRWLVFALGVLVYWCLNYADRRSWWAGLTALGGAAALGAFLRVGPVAFPLAPSTPSLGTELAVGGAFAVALMALRPFDDRLAAAGALRPLMFVGRISYSLYLVHVLLIKPLSLALYEIGVRGHFPTLLVAVPVCIVAATAVAWGFYEIVEKRFLNPPQRVTERSAR